MERFGDERWKPIRGQQLGAVALLKLVANQLERVQAVMAERHMRILDAVRKVEEFRRDRQVG